MRVLIISYIILFSCTNCITREKNLKFNEFYYSTGYVLKLETSIHPWHEPVVIYLSENKVAFYYINSYRNRIIDLKLDHDGFFYRDYSMVGTNEVFKYSKIHSSLKITKPSKEKSRINKNYWEFYNMRKIK